MEISSRATAPLIQPRLLRWTITGGSGLNISGNQNPESGSCAVGFGSGGTQDHISQTIDTTAGDEYPLYFYFDDSHGGDNPSAPTFTVTWDGTQILNLDGAEGTGYEEYQFLVTASGSSAVLDFGGNNPPLRSFLDNVSLEQVTPEPGTFVLGGLAAGVLLAVRRRNGFSNQK